MIEVELAKNAGFCFGVKRAMEAVTEQLNQNHCQPIYTFGPLIHNGEVVRELENKGVRVVSSLDELRVISRGIMIIRSHGVSKETYEMMQSAGFLCVDATCPFVKRIHKIVEKRSTEGEHIIIVGNNGHPEVDGIKGWCAETPVIIESKEAAENFTTKLSGKFCIVSQTTFNYNKFKDIVEIIQKKGYDINVVDTICNATRERQEEAEALALRADVMIVIGDKNSSNTRKLYEICKNKCAMTHFIQTLDDLHLELPKSVRLVGITAGASTPNNIIEEVQNYVRINF